MTCMQIDRAESGHAVAAGRRHGWPRMADLPAPIRQVLDTGRGIAPPPSARAWLPARMQRAARVAAGFVVLIACLQLGKVLAPMLPLPLPPPLIGMALLAMLVACHNGVAARTAADAGTVLLRRYALFFVPAGVGVVAHTGALQAAWLGIAVSVLMSSMLAVIVTGLTMRALLAGGAHGRARCEGDTSS